MCSRRSRAEAPLNPFHRQAVLAGLLTLGVLAAVTLRWLTDPGPSRPVMEEVVVADPVMPWEGPGWRVIDRYSGHWVLVVSVETDRIDEAGEIARELVEPVKRDHSEVLVYFYRPGTTRELASTRVQWTSRAGYVETNYEELEGR